MAGRPYKEVPVRAVNVQHNRTRFNGQWNRSYLISRWRGNLTALSQKYNLYFVCCRDRIQVYQPVFPHQSLPLKPSMVIDPPVSSDDLYGYIDQSVPHSINRVLVGFLGNEEVLLVACDDGDVVGFYTDSIHRLLLRRTEQQETSASHSTGDLRPFFHVNVGKSAWGLAIHQEARKIAVSCNTQRVTVFAFALVADADPKGMSGMESEEPVAQEPLDRADNEVIELPEAEHNIPHVSFCNTDDDPKGRFLLATDIVGNMIMYDIHERSVIRGIRCAYCKTGAVAEHKCLCSDRRHYPHALWGAFWLDRRSFSRQQDVRSTTGLKDLVSSQLSRSWALDISRSRHDVPDASLEYIPRQGSQVETRILDEVDDDDDTDYMDEDVSVEEHIEPPDGSEDDAPSNAHSTMQAQASPSQQLATPSPAPAHPGLLQPAHPGLTLMQQLELAATAASPTPSPSSSSSLLWTGSLHSPPAFRPEIQAIIQRPKRLHYIVTRSPPKSRAPASPPACPILQLSIKDITLFQPRASHKANTDNNNNNNNNTNSNAIHQPRDAAHEAPSRGASTAAAGGDGPNPHSGAASPPAVFLHDVLWQRIPATEGNPFYNSDHLGRMSRFSLVEAIPPLGVVLAGSPSGRVAVLSLAQTRVALPASLSSLAPSRAERRTSGGGGGGGVSSSSSGGPGGATPRSGAARTFYSMRVDHILPFQSQEDAGDRPERLLLGLAVSPVQGMLLGERPRQQHGYGHGYGHGHGRRRRPADVDRWRVLLMYEDQSVLSYEVGRPRAAGPGAWGAGVAEVVPL